MPPFSHNNAHPNAPARQPGPQPITEFARRSTIAVLLALLLILIAYACWRGFFVLLEAFAGMMLAIFFNALSTWLTRHSRLSYRWALTVVVLVLFVLAGGGGWLIGNRLAEQAQSLTTELPQSFEHIKDYLEQQTWGRVLLQHTSNLGNLAGNFSQVFQVKDVLTSLVTFVEVVIVMLVVGIFGAAEPELYRAGLLHLVPPPHRLRAEEAIDTVVHNLRWWLVGQFCLMVIIGLTTMLGLWLIGVPLALTLGVLAGVLEMIPYLGAWLSAVPAALMALLLSPIHLVGVLALYLFLHILEGYILVPLIQRRAVHLPPALTIVMQVFLGKLLGLMGLFVAAPLTVMLVVLLKMLYVEDTLGDQAVDVPGEPGNEAKPVASEAHGS
jgi:predicted PurR-regulated permease PerM